MLIGLNPLLSPDLLHALAAMGHGDEIVVVDANFANDTVIVGVPDGYEIFEQQKGAISAEANDGSLSRTIAFRGYLATLMIESAKFRKAAFV